MNKKKLLPLLLITAIVTACSESIGPDFKTGKINNTRGAVVHRDTFLSSDEFNKLDQEYSQFTTKSFSQGYLDKKIAKWIALGVNGGTNLTREIEFARIKHSQLLVDLVAAKPSYKTPIATSSEVLSKRSSQNTFDTYVKLLLGDVSYTISTVAGNGISGGGGNGGQATSASLVSPVGVTVDSVGNIFITDINFNEIRKVNSSGIISNVPGTSVLVQPIGMKVDSSGNIYIADSITPRVRKLDTNGTLTTIAGTGTAGYNNDNIDATSAKLNSPTDVAFDSTGNLFIADYSNQRIRKVDTNGVITTIAGNGTEGYSGDGGAATNAMLDNPKGIKLDSTGNLFIADYSNQRIRKVDTNGVITTVAGNGTNGFSGDGGPATSAKLNNPNGLTLDNSGNIFIADRTNNRIRKVDASGTITTIAGGGSVLGDGGPATSAYFINPSGVALDSSGNLYISDSGNHLIRKLTVAY